MSFRCRKHGETTTHVVDDVTAGSAPNAFAKKHLNMQGGTIAFVEVQLEDGKWELWRVECIVAGRAYMNARVDEAQMEWELTQRLASARKKS